MEAAQEVTAARAAIEADHQTALTNLSTVKSVLAVGLAFEPWKIDVLIAALGSIVINRAV